MLSSPVEGSASEVDQVVVVLGHKHITEERNGHTEVLAVQVSKRQ